MKRNKHDPSRIPGWMWTVICIVLGLAVLVGAVAFVLQMGYFEEGFDFNAIPTNMEQPLTNGQESEADEAEETEDTEPEEPEVKVCTGLAISQKSVELDEVGERVFLTVAITPEDCDDEILYTSSDEDVVTVSATGMLTAVGSGEAEVLIACGTFTETCVVTCTFGSEEDEQLPVEEETEQTEEEETAQTEVPAVEPTVTPSDFTLFYPGEEAYLYVKDVPEGETVSYVSSNGGVVTVSPGGKVTAVGQGMATITITVGEKQITSIARCNFDATTEG